MDAFILALLMAKASFGMPSAFPNEAVLAAPFYPPLHEMMLAVPVPYEGREVLNRTRACLPTSTQQSISTSTNSAASTQLSANSVHYITCSADTFVRWSSSAPTAVTTDIPLWAGMWFPFISGPSNARYVAGILSTGTGYCRILTCE